MQNPTLRRGRPAVALPFLCLILAFAFLGVHRCTSDVAPTLPAIRISVPIPDPSGPDPKLDPVIPMLMLARAPEPVRRVVNHLRATAPRWNPLSGFRGGRIFRNLEGKLPRGTVYREYDVRPLQSGVSRGGERLVISADRQTVFYTTDHYQSFQQILLP